MRPTFLNKAFNGTLSERFETTKKMSDYAGMLTRLIFLAVITIFAFRQVDFEAVKGLSYSAITYAIFVGLLALFDVLFFVSFMGLTQGLIMEAFWLERVNNPSRIRRIFRGTAHLLVIITILVALVSVFDAIPKLTTQFANIQLNKFAPEQEQRKQ